MPKVNVDVNDQSDARIQQETKEVAQPISNENKNAMDSSLAAQVQNSLAGKKAGKEKFLDMSQLNSQLNSKQPVKQIKTNKVMLLNSYLDFMLTVPTYKYQQTALGNKISEAFLYFEV